VWQHLAASREGSSVRYFKNGSQVGSTFTNSGDIDIASYEPLIGALTPGSPPSFPFNGYIQDLRISDTALYTGTFTPPGSLT